MVLSVLSVGPEPLPVEPIDPIDPIVSPPDAIPPAFLDDDGEGSEWGWSDWDGVEWHELRDIRG